MRLTSARFYARTLALGLALLACAVSKEPASANWLTKALQEAGEAGGRGAARSLDAGDRHLKPAFDHVRGLPDKPGETAIAAHAGAEGHWRFINKNGETYTAGTAAELSRVRSALAPDSAGKLAIYLSPETAFSQRALLADLPPDADLFVAGKSGGYAIERGSISAPGPLRIAVRPRMRLAVPDTKLFDEAVFQLAQPLKPSTVRIVALETGAADSLNIVPRFDAATKTAVIDRVDPRSLARAIAGLKRQTVVLTGRLEADALVVAAGSGGEVRLPLAAIRTAAREADVNLVIVRSNSARQPGGRNWLWQTANVPGMDRAVTQATFGDFLATLAGEGGSFTLSARADGFGRTALEAIPEASAPALPLGDTIAGWFDEVSGSVTGNIAVAGVEASLRDKERQSELDWRIIPFIPSLPQILYLAGLALSFFGPVTAWCWWAKIWPPEAREEYGRASGYWLARMARLVVYVLIFLPLAGLPLFLRYLALQIGAIVMIPVNVLRWIAGKFRPRSA